MGLTKFEDHHNTGRKSRVRAFSVGCTMHRSEKERKNTKKGGRRRSPELDEDPRARHTHNRGEGGGLSKAQGEKGGKAQVRGHRLDQRVGRQSGRKNKKRGGDRRKRSGERRGGEEKKEMGRKRNCTLGTWGRRGGDPRGRVCALMRSNKGRRREGRERKNRGLFPDVLQPEGMIIHDSIGVLFLFVLGS